MTNTTQPRIIPLTVIEDSGHAWLVVHIDQIRELGLETKISRYSYRNGTAVYLEEDIDAPHFETAASNVGWYLTIGNFYIDGLCFVRNLAPYSCGSSIRG